MGTGWAQREARGTQRGSRGGSMGQRLEPKASQPALGSMLGVALNLKPVHCPSGAQGHQGRMVAQMVALQGLMGK